MRTCGDCKACCKLPPHKDLGKPGNKRCDHLSNARGCKIYASRPNACRLYRCQWLSESDTADIGRPDRSHYIIDPAPDMITMRNDATGVETYYQAVQIWCDPRWPDAWKDQALMRFLARRSEENIIAIVRYGDNVNDFVLFPPKINGTDAFHARRGDQRTGETPIEEMFEKLGGDNLRICP